MNAIIASSLRTSLLRYSRSWGLWLLLLVAPVGARYMLPRGDGGGGTVIAIGGHLPVMTAPFQIHQPAAVEMDLESGD